MPKPKTTVAPPEPVKPTKIIRDAAFAQRLALACDGNAKVPPYNFGRLTWFKNQLLERFGETASVETIRKWFAGEVKPRPDKVKVLAEMLEVDEGWLSLGIEPELQPREQKVRNAMADGAVNLLAGVIQMNGGHPAFPKPDDKRATKEHIDLYAIIKGAQYGFHVSLGQPVDKQTVKFTLPTNYDGAFQMGIVQEDSTRFLFVELTGQTVSEHGVRKGGSIEVTVPQAELKLRQIKSFRDRI